MKLTILLKLPSPKQLVQDGPVSGQAAEPRCKSTHRKQKHGRRLTAAERSEIYHLHDSRRCEHPSACAE